jgi:hypothetical protein
MSLPQNRFLVASLLVVTPCVGCFGADEAQRPQLTPYDSAADGFRISYPHGWKQIPQETLKRLQEVREKGGQMGVVRAAFYMPSEGWNFIVCKAEFPKPVSLKEAHESIVEGAKANSLKLGRYKFMAANKTTLDKTSAMTHEFLQLTPDRQRAKVMQVCTMHGQTCWMVSFSGPEDDFERQRDVFEAILRSFSTAKPATGDKGKSRG